MRHLVLVSNFTPNGVETPSIKPMFCIKHGRKPAEPIFSWIFQALVRVILGFSCFFLESNE
jgi:hypothetical protein